jgi:hypothetical protein
MVSRTPDGYSQLLRDNYALLKDSVEGFYAGSYAKALEIAVRLRTLVHQSDARPGQTPSRPLLDFIDPQYLKLSIYHKLPTPGVAFAVNQRIQVGVSSIPKFVRAEFTTPPYSLVTLEQWWTTEYLALGTVRSSKKQITLDIANKDGGAHVDANVPTRHAAASEPPVVFGGTDGQFYRLNFARGIVAEAGSELLDYLERHFHQVLRGLIPAVTIEQIKNTATNTGFQRMPLADPIRVLFTRGENFLNVHTDGKWAFYKELVDGKKPDHYGMDLESLQAFWTTAA